MEILNIFIPKIVVTISEVGIVTGISLAIYYGPENTAIFIGNVLDFTMKYVIKLIPKLIEVVVNLVKDLIPALLALISRFLSKLVFDIVKPIADFFNIDYPDPFADPYEAEKKWIEEQKRRKYETDDYIVDGLIWTSKKTGIKYQLIRVKSDYIPRYNEIELLKGQFVLSPI